MRRRGDPWFKFYPQDWIDGTRDLTPEQRGAYIDMIALQMLSGDPVKDDYAWLGHQMHISSRKARSLVESLIEATKLIRTERGILNERAAVEIEAREKQRRANSEIAVERERKNREKSVKLPRTIRETSAKIADNDVENCELTNEINEWVASSCHERSTTRARSDTDTELEISNNPLSPLRGDGMSEPKPAPRKRIPYSDDFEKFWSEYPDTRGMSKANAWKRWRALTADERDAAYRALPAFRELLAERRRKSPDAVTLHAEGYLSQRRFETLAEAKPAGPWWKDPNLLAEMTLERWRKGIRQYANGIWRVAELGPAPGHPQCVVPAQLIAELRLDEIYDSQGMRRCN